MRAGNNVINTVVIELKIFLNSSENVFDINKSNISGVIITVIVHKTPDTKLCSLLY